MQVRIIPEAVRELEGNVRAVQREILWRKLLHLVRKVTQRVCVREEAQCSPVSALCIVIMGAGRFRRSQAQRRVPTG